MRLRTGGEGVKRHARSIKTIARSCSFVPESLQMRYKPREKRMRVRGVYAGINPGRPALDILEEPRIFLANEGRGDSGSRLCIRLVGSRLCNDLSLLWTLDRDLPIQMQQSRTLKIRPLIERILLNVKSFFDCDFSFQNRAFNYRSMDLIINHCT